MEDRVLTPNMAQLMRRNAELSRSVDADRQLIELLQAEKTRRDPLYFAARAFCSAIYAGLSTIETARLYQALLVAHSATTPHPEEEAS